LAAVAWAFGEVYSHYEGPLFSASHTVRRWMPSAKKNPASAIDEFIETLNGARRAYGASLDAIGDNDLEAVREASKNTAAAIDRLRDAPSVGRTADAWTQRVLAALESEYGLERDIDRAEAVTSVLHQRAQENTRRYLGIAQELDQWVRSEGDRYGLELKDEE
jgi:hypothetical protein